MNIAETLDFEIQNTFGVYSDWLLITDHFLHDCFIVTSNSILLKTHF